MGLAGMVNSVVRECDIDLWDSGAADADAVLAGDRFAVARAITGAELGKLPADFLERMRGAAAQRVTPVLGIDRKSTRLNSSHVKISYAVFCLKKKNKARD